MTSFAHDAVAYSIERLVRLTLGGATSILVARHLGADDFGFLAFVLAVFGIAVPFATLGMPSVLVRDFVTRDRWQRSYASALACQLPVALVAGTGGGTVVLWAKGGEPDATTVTALLCALPLLATATTPRSWLEAERAATLVATIGVLASLTSGSLRVVGILTGQGITWFAASNLIEAAILFVGLGWAVKRRAPTRPRRADANAADARRLLKASLPLLVAGIAIAVYMMIDVVMLGLLRSNDDAGIYSAAVRISEAWYFIPLAVMSAARPRLSAALANDATQYRADTGRVLRVLAALAYVGALLTMLLAERVINWLFGSEFEESTTVLRIHILAAPFVFLGTGASQAFVDLDLTRVAMWRSIAGAIVNVALNIWLIPRHGPAGAAFATVASYGLSGVLLNFVSRPTRWLFFQQARALVLLPPKPA